MSHRDADGMEHPIAFDSQSLSAAERKYAHLDKEGLAIVFGVEKFHPYLMGRQFTICSDHKPLQHIFSETKPIPTLASARIQRWALTLSPYNYRICYKPGSENSNADVLSRLPLPGLPDIPSSVPIPGETVFLMDILQSSPIDISQICNATSKDPVVSKVQTLILQGWTYTPISAKKGRVKCA